MPSIKTGPLKRYAKWIVGIGFVAKVIDLLAGVDWVITKWPGVVRFVRETSLPSASTTVFVCGVLLFLVAVSVDRMKREGSLASRTADRVTPLHVPPDTGDAVPSHQMLGSKIQLRLELHPDQLTSSFRCLVEDPRRITTECNYPVSLGTLVGITATYPDQFPGAKPVVPGPYSVTWIGEPFTTLGAASGASLGNVVKRYAFEVPEE